MSNSIVKEWFFDNFENVLDELTTINNLRKEIILSNDDEFEEEITHQSYDEFVRSISISCASQLNLPYEYIYDTLEDKLEELYNTIEDV